MVKVVKRKPKTEEVKASTDTLVERETSFGSMVKELNSPTSYVGQLNRSKEWQAGFEASRRGVLRTRNPYGYPAVTDDAKDWQDGWECKFFGGSHESRRGFQGPI